jgi:hypothetical protein
MLFYSSSTCKVFETLQVLYLLILNVCLYLQGFENLAGTAYHYFKFSQPARFFSTLQVLYLFMQNVYYTYKVLKTLQEHQLLETLQESGSIILL